MTEVISVLSNKGGTGKTSFTTNLAGVLSADSRVLIIDTDGQGNSSLAFGVPPNSLTRTLYNVIAEGLDVNEAILNVEENIDILPSNADMNFIEFEILPNIKKYDKPFELLKEVLSDIEQYYDYVIIDTPPSMGLVAGNVLTASDSVVIPFVPETFAVQGLTRVIQAIQDFKGTHNNKLHVRGVVGMMVDSRTNLHNETLEQAREWCSNNGITLFNTVVPKSIRFASSTAYLSKPATLTDKSNSIVKAYYKIKKEMFE